MVLRSLGLGMLCLLTTFGLAQNEATVKVDSVALKQGTCASSFVTHTLDHITTVPGGNEVRMFEANGGGVGLGDLDNDGDLDIVLANHAGPNSILWNEGGLQFRKEALGEGEARAVTLVDVDADGLLDIVFSRRVSAPNFWHNEGDGKFALELLPGIDKPLYALNWADLDGDGDLDLVGASYDAALLTEFGQEFLESGKAGVYVYLNDGERFTETKLADNAQALTLILTDLNEDGRPDIWVGNDFAVPDRVFLNTPEGWQTDDSFAATTHSTMSLETGDLDNDGGAEIFATDMKPYPQEAEEPWLPMMEMMMEPHAEGDPQIMENVLQRRTGETFSNEAAARGYRRDRLELVGQVWRPRPGRIFRLVCGQRDDGKHDFCRAAEPRTRRGKPGVSQRRNGSVRPDAFLGSRLYLERARHEHGRPGRRR